MRPTEYHSAQTCHFHIISASGNRQLNEIQQIHDGWKDLVGSNMILKGLQWQKHAF